jgi:Bacterial membrane protein YfhO
VKRAAALLTIVLVVIFLPFASGRETLLSSARDVPSVLPKGAPGNAPSPNFLKVPDAGAAGWQTEPYFAVEHDELVRRHVLPSWNPYSGFGAPLAANLQSQPYYPLSFLYALAPSPVTYNWWVILRLLVAGLGMFAFLRWHVSFFPALLGAVATMLTGFYVIHYDMPHLSVDVMLPWLLFCVEYAMRKPGPWSFAAAFAAGYCAVAGGMPESTVLVFAFTVVYFAFVVWTHRADRPAALRGAATFGAALGLGVAACAIVLLPFLEFWHVSFNSHDPSNGAAVLPGPLKERLDATIGQYIAPLLIGPTRNDIFTGFAGASGLRGYFGVAAVFFALIAVFDALDRRLKGRSTPADATLAFFAAAALVLLLKRYGFPLVNWIGYLPALRYVIFPLFQESLLGVCVAACAAFGLERLIASRVHVATTIASAAVWFAALTGLEAAYAPKLGGAVHPEYFEWAMTVAIVALAAAFAVALTAGNPRLRVRGVHVLGPAAVAVVALELSFNYVVPLFYQHNPEPPSAADPYRGAPFVTYLRSVAPAGRARVLGKDGYLYPNWSGAFELAGVTQLDALTYERYLPWIRAFLDNPGGAHDPSLYDRYTGISQNTFGSRLERRFLQVSSARYVVADALTTGSETLYDAVREQLAPLASFAAAQGAAQPVNVGGRSEDGFLLQPPFRAIAFTLDVPANATRLAFDAGVPVVQGEHCTAPAALRVELRAGARAVAAGTLSPARAGRWFTQRLDVRALRGRRASATLAASARGGRGCAPTLAWAGLRYEPAAATVSTSALRRLTAVKDAPVYELTPVLPRAALFSGIDLQPSGPAALGAVTAPGFDVFSRAVVETPPGAAAPELRALAAGPSAAAQPATVVRYDPARVVVDARPARPALLMLNDLKYPGWTATLDGAPVAILAADYLFRGVVVPAGNHQVVFSYEPPSQRIGMAISLAAALAGALAVLVLAWRRRAAGGAPLSSP